MVSILFVQQDSIYKKIRGGTLDCWDFERDAARWPGGNPIVAHPPCREWSQMRGFSMAPVGEKELAVLAVGWVRRWGGVLEHPKGSTLWPALSLPLPGATDKFGGHSLCVDQAWWGHRARKSTMLYVVGCPPKGIPDVPISFDAIQRVLNSRRRPSKGGLQEVTKRERSATPEKFAEWLVELAERCQK
jgi:hypothetical protein